MIFHLFNVIYVRLHALGDFVKDWCFIAFSFRLEKSRVLGSPDFKLYLKMLFKLCKLKAVFLICRFLFLDFDMHRIDYLQDFKIDERYFR